MMTLEQHALVKLAEECSEVQKRALKQAQFGRNQHDEGYEPNHWRLRDELLDVLACVRILERYGDILPISNEDVTARLYEKAAKIEKFRALSRSLGMLE